ncbi:hypothetical protein BTR14_20435 [Rhizobium rhizosphaerae]|uniref:DUF721 domain-containing protein n=1 Tax=Xaviernesmea rhizosphaerae TaxID=1672749 RepID=A0ABX3P9H0_9HYPH|nr:DciA family protein [Xaviernesmea rhizosphaerae]OQP84175.1 hypothetical protein BTR14_20435 [Xaviernesmea rhizosphaerae]
MKKSVPSRGIVQISEIANGIIDPVLARRAGINTFLLGAWDEIVGAEFALSSRPEKIAWPPRERDANGREAQRPGTLVVACEGAQALFLSHAKGEMIERINSFFGFPAIVQVRIVQKPVSPPPRPGRRLRPLDAASKMELEDMVSGIESETLKAALRRLGRGVLAAR